MIRNPGIPSDLIALLFEEIPLADGGGVLLSTTTISMEMLEWFATDEVDEVEKMQALIVHSLMGQLMKAHSELIAYDKHDRRQASHIGYALKNNSILQEALRLREKKLCEVLASLARFKTILMTGDETDPTATVQRLKESMNIISAPNDATTSSDVADSGKTAGDAETPPPAKMEGDDGADAVIHTGDEVSDDGK